MRIPKHKKNHKKLNRVLKPVCVSILIFMFTSTAADRIASQDYMEINARDRNTLYGVTWKNTKQHQPHPV